MRIQFVNRQRHHDLLEASQLVTEVMNQIMITEPFGRLSQKRHIEPAVVVSFVGEKRIRQINAQQRGVDRVTDVLSFPMLDLIDGRLCQPLQDADLDRSLPGQPQVMLGDVLICLDQASKQALAYGHSRDREIGFLAAHGLLHLLGYDHDTPDRERKQLYRQRRALRQLGLER